MSCNLPLLSLSSACAFTPSESLCSRSGLRRYGRRSTMLLGGICFLIGAVLTSAAYQLPQLVIGRVVLGFGVGV